MSETSSIGEVVPATTRDDARDDRRNDPGANMAVAVLAHELKTPVNAILGYSEMLASGNVPAERQADHAATLWEAAQALHVALDAILDMARLQAGEIDLADEEVDIAATVQSAARMLATSAAARRVRIDARIPPDLPAITGDPRMIRQILMNLMSNAIKYGAEAGRVRITARVDRAGRLLLDVMDDGEGIAPADVEAVMQPFGRGRATATIPGSGLGLPLTKTLVELHDGTFRLIGTPGKGTRAIVSLPAARIAGESGNGQGAFMFVRPPTGAPKPGRSDAPDSVRIGR